MDQVCRKYLRFPGPLPVATIALKYVDRIKAAERFVPRADHEPEPPRKDGAPDAAADEQTDAASLPLKDMEHGTPEETEMPEDRSGESQEHVLVPPEGKTGNGNAALEPRDATERDGEEAGSSDDTPATPDDAPPDAGPASRGRLIRT